MVDKPRNESTEERRKNIRTKTSRLKANAVRDDGKAPGHASVKLKLNKNEAGNGIPQVAPAEAQQPDASEGDVKRNSNDTITDVFHVRDQASGNVSQVNPDAETGATVSAVNPEAGKAGRKAETVRLKVVQQKKKELDRKVRAHGTVKLRPAAGSNESQTSEASEQTVKVNASEQKRDIKTDSGSLMLRKEVEGAGTEAASAAAQEETKQPTLNASDTVAPRPAGKAGAVKNTGNSNSTIKLKAPSKESATPDKTVKQQVSASDKTAQSAPPPSDQGGGAKKTLKFKTKDQEEQSEAGSKDTVSIPDDSGKAKSTVSLRPDSGKPKATVSSPDDSQKEERQQPASTVKYKDASDTDTERASVSEKTVKYEDEGSTTGRKTGKNVKLKRGSGGSRKRKKADLQDTGTESMPAPAEESQQQQQPQSDVAAMADTTAQPGVLFTLGVLMSAVAMGVAFYFILMSNMSILN